MRPSERRGERRRESCAARAVLGVAIAGSNHAGTTSDAKVRRHPEAQVDRCTQFRWSNAETVVSTDASRTQPEALRAGRTCVVDERQPMRRTPLRRVRGSERAQVRRSAERVLSSACFNNIVRRSRRSDLYPLERVPTSKFERGVSHGRTGNTIVVEHPIRTLSGEPMRSPNMQGRNDDEEITCK